jgi:copper chaperone CopZ
MRRFSIEQARMARSFISRFFYEVLIMLAVLNVKGMKCGGCETNVRNALEALSGVVSVQPSHKENKVEVDFDEAVANLDDIRAAIVAKGFSVE